MENSVICSIMQLKYEDIYTSSTQTIGYPVIVLAWQLSHSTIFILSH